jgi:hypothetical protein
MLYIQSKSHKIKAGTFQTMSNFEMSDVNYSCPIESLVSIAGAKQYVANARMGINGLSSERLSSY